MVFTSSPRLPCRVHPPGSAQPFRSRKRGCERLVVNELTESSLWHTVWQHRWKRPAHTNSLEGAVSEVWEERDARRGGGRIVGLADSRVTLCFRLKGRSSSRAIRASLLCRAPVVLAGGVYPAYLFTPSRLNPSDDPSRFVPLRGAARQRPT